MKHASQTAYPGSRRHWFTESSLRQSFRRGECLICSNLISYERRAIHSYLYEGMMSPDVRADFLKGGGFCLRHFWVAKRIEEQCWPTGGIGVAILCENLIQKVHETLPNCLNGKHHMPSRFSHKRNTEANLMPGHGCIFCRGNEEYEHSTTLMLGGLVREVEWCRRLGEAPLCLRHALAAVCLWQESEAQERTREHLQKQLSELGEEIREFIRKRDWQYRDELRGREQNAVSRAVEFLVGPIGQFPAKENEENPESRDSETSDTKRRSLASRGGNRNAG